MSTRFPKKGSNNSPRGYTPARVLAKLPACYACCRKLPLYGTGWLEGLCSDCADVKRGRVV